MLSPYLCQLSACAQKHFRCMNNKKMVSFLHVRINYRVCKLRFFFLEKGGVQINRVYELIEILQYMSCTTKFILLETVPPQSKSLSYTSGLVMFLPPYGPNLNPIELAFARVKV